MELIAVRWLVSATLLPIAFFTFLAIEFSGHFPHVFDGQPRPDILGKLFGARVGLGLRV